MDKYEYLSGEDLGLKPSTVEEARFEYSPLVKMFSKGLDEDDKKEGFFKRLRLKSIENPQKIELIIKIKKMRIKKQQQQSNNIESKQQIVFDYLKSLSQEAKDLIDEIKQVHNDINDDKLLLIDSNKKMFNFNTLINH